MDTEAIDTSSNPVSKTSVLLQTNCDQAKRQFQASKNTPFVNKSYIDKPTQY